MTPVTATQLGDELQYDLAPRETWRREFQFADVVEERAAPDMDQVLFRNSHRARQAYGYFCNPQGVTFGFLVAQVQSVRPTLDRRIVRLGEGCRIILRSLVQSGAVNCVRGNIGDRGEIGRLPPLVHASEYRGLLVRLDLFRRALKRRWNGVCSIGGQICQHTSAGRLA